MSNNGNSKKDSCLTDTNLFPTEDAGILGLEDKIKGYNMWLIGIGIFIAFVILTKLFNPFQLTTKIIYMIISTIIFFICIALFAKMFINVKKGIADTDGINNMVYIIGAVCAFAIILIITFSDDFKKNKELSLNYYILFAVLGLSCFAYIFITQDDDISKQNLPKGLQMFYNERTKYSIIFLLYIFAIALLYFYDPWNIMTTYIGVSTFFTVSIGLMIFLMIFLYHYFFTHPSKEGLFSQSPTLATFMRSFYILGALGVSGFLIYSILSWLGTFNQDAYSTSNILNLIMLIGMLGIIWKLVNSGGFFENNPIFKLILNTILYIPCLLVNILDFITGQYKQTKQTEVTFLLFALGIFAGFFIIKFYLYPYISTKYYGQGGKSWINEPVSTEHLTNIASYQELNANATTNINENDNSDLQNSAAKYNYQYAISFWIYLDSFSPSTSVAYNKVSNILSYGENPCVKYDGVNNTILITVKNDGDSRIALQNVKNKEGFTISDIKNKIEEAKAMPIALDLDNMGNRIIYKKPNVLLQKWNNIIINYNGGTLDVFYNGELVKSAIEVVPYMKFDMLTVGAEQGISGNIANLVYFDKPIDYLQVHTLYNSLKSTNPPIIPDSGTNIIQKIKELV